MLKNFRYAGFNEITTPVLLINDPDLIKQICMKDFDHFPEHQTFSADSNIDPLWDTNLFASRGRSMKFTKEKFCNCEF